MSDDDLPPPSVQLAGINPRVELELFAPTVTQARAKARLHAQLREHAETMDLDRMPAQEIAELAGHTRVLQWLKDPGFAAWLFDRDSYVYDALALRETAVQILGDILLSDYEPKILTAKDKLKAADMLLTLTGAYPAKQRDVRFLDAGLDAMPDDQVQAELAAMRKTLAKLPSE